MLTGMEVWIHALLSLAISSYAQVSLLFYFLFVFNLVFVCLVVVFLFFPYEHCFVSIHMNVQKHNVTCSSQHVFVKVGGQQHFSVPVLDGSVPGKLLVVLRSVAICALSGNRASISK